MNSRYVGTELELFALACNWRSYWISRISPFLGRKVLEVGAGLGSVTLRLSNDANDWLALEPDVQMAGAIETLENLPSRTRVLNGDISTVPPGLIFDTILYVDVLEHIEGDSEELILSANLLRAGGYLIVLAPAHNWLLSPFDLRIGHHRRYSRRDLPRLTIQPLVLIHCEHLDAVGFLLSCLNRFVFKQSMPRRFQVILWDRLLIPVTRIVDVLMRRKFGKSVLMVWRKPEDDVVPSLLPRSTLE